MVNLVCYKIGILWSSEIVKQKIFQELKSTSLLEENFLITSVVFHNFKTIIDSICTSINIVGNVSTMNKLMNKIIKEFRAYLHWSLFWIK